MTADGFVLVHGGFHGAWCWAEVLPRLRLPAIAVDLPGRGHRPLDGQPLTLDGCAATVLAEADAAGLEHFVLVGHSMGGLTITATAARAPERVARLVFVGALVPSPGETVYDIFGVTPADRVRDRAGVQPVPPDDVARAMFGNDLTDDQWAAAAAQLVAEPAGLFWATLDRHPCATPATYVSLTQDVPVPPDRARAMIRNLGPGVDHREIDGGHSVMLSRPDTLATLLNDLAR